MCCSIISSKNQQFGKNWNRFGGNLGFFPEKIGKNGQTWKEQLSKSNLNFSILFSD